MNALVPTPDVIAEAKRREEEMEMRLLDEAARDEQAEVMGLWPHELDDEERMRRRIQRGSR